MKQTTFSGQKDIGRIRVKNISYELFAPWEIVHAILSSADFFQNQLFQTILSGIPSECQTDWIQIWSNILSGLTCVQSGCKGYGQTTPEVNELMFI